MASPSSCGRARRSTSERPVKTIDLGWCTYPRVDPMGGLQWCTWPSQSKCNGRFAPAAYFLAPSVWDVGRARIERLAMGVKSSRTIHARTRHKRRE
jgi:hypothetical protein